MNEKEERWKEKSMYGQFVREIPESTDVKKTWEWLRKTDLKIQTESLLCAAQELALRTNYVKHHIDKSAESPFCRMCEAKGKLYVIL